MEIKLLGQGFEGISENSVGNHLIRFFVDENFDSFLGISAFTSEAAVLGLSKYISSSKKHLRNITIITGVDQKGTSREALEALYNLEIDVYIFFAPPPFPIFHPKIYLFEGKEKSELIIGSSNLTMSGLFSNVETSLLISIDNHSVEDRKIIEQLKDYFKGIFDYSDPNLKKITTHLIYDLVLAKIVPTEKERKAEYSKTDKEERKGIETIFGEIFPKRKTAKIPDKFRRTTKPKDLVKVKEIKPSISGITSKLLWESGPLTERDLNIPKGANTNRTGSMNLKKGLLVDIDQRNYFRNTVFKSLDWKHDPTPSKAHLERATATFRIIVFGKDYGDFILTLNHNTKTDTITYKQNNSMTSISWGKAKEVISNEALIGKNAALYINEDKITYTLLMG